MAVIARCKGCGAEAILKPDNTIMAPCDCALRDPAVGLDVAEYVLASQLHGAVAKLDAARVTVALIVADITSDPAEAERLGEEYGRRAVKWLADHPEAASGGQ